jgi:hypothetical protein
MERVFSSNAALWQGVTKMLLTQVACHKQGQVLLIYNVPWICTFYFICPKNEYIFLAIICFHILIAVSHFWLLIVRNLDTGGADKSSARPGRKQTATTKDFDFRISYL